MYSLPSSRTKICCLALSPPRYFDFLNSKSIWWSVDLDLLIFFFSARFCRRWCRSRTLGDHQEQNTPTWLIRYHSSNCHFNQSLKPFSGHNRIRRRMGSRIRIKLEVHQPTRWRNAPSLCAACSQKYIIVIRVVCILDELGFQPFVLTDSEVFLISTPWTNLM